MTRPILLAAAALAIRPPRLPGATISDRAPIAYVLALSSGAALFAKIPPTHPRRRCPDDNHRSGVRANAGGHLPPAIFTVRPTWRKWHGPGGRRGPVGERAGQRAEPAPRLVPLSSMTRRGARRMHRRTEEAFAGNNARPETWPQNAISAKHAGDRGCPSSGARPRDLCARVDQAPPSLKQFLRQPSFTWARRWLGQVKNPGNLNPISEDRRSDAQDRPHRRGRLRLTGSAAERARLVMVCRGLKSWDERVRAVR